MNLAWVRRMDATVERLERQLMANQTLNQAIEVLRDELASLRVALDACADEMAAIRKHRNPPWMRNFGSSAKDRLDEEHPAACCGTATPQAGFSVTDEDTNG